MSCVFAVDVCLHGRWLSNEAEDSSIQDGRFSWMASLPTDG